MFQKLFTSNLTVRKSFWKRVSGLEMSKNASNVKKIYCNTVCMLYMGNYLQYCLNGQLQIRLQLPGNPPLFGIKIMWRSNDIKKKYIRISCTSQFCPVFASQYKTIISIAQMCAEDIERPAEIMSHNQMFVGPKAKEQSSHVPQRSRNDKLLCNCLGSVFI